MHFFLDNNKIVFIVYLFMFLVFLLSVFRDTSTTITVLFNKIWIGINFYVCVCVWSKNNFIFLTLKYSCHLK